APRHLHRFPTRRSSDLIVALIVALAAPRTGATAIDIEADGIAIMLVVDISSSMLAEDFHPDNRLAVAKAKVADFVRGRRYDRIGDRKSTRLNSSHVKIS